MSIDEIKDILEKLDFPKKFITEQTAICIKAMIDKIKRKGLLVGQGFSQINVDRYIQ